VAKRLLLLSALAAIAVTFEPIHIRTPFELRVLDEQTGVGVPVRITADNGIERDTPNGYVYWWASSLMSRDVDFEIDDPTNQFDSLVATVRVIPGGHATLKVHRRA